MVDLEGCLLAAVEERGVFQVVVGRCVYVVFVPPAVVAVDELLH